MEKVLECLHQDGAEFDLFENDDVRINFSTAFIDSQIELVISIRDVARGVKMELSPDTWNKLLDAANVVHEAVIKGQKGKYFASVELDAHVRHNGQMYVICLIDPRLGETNTQMIVMNMVSFEALCQQAEPIAYAYEKEYANLKVLADALKDYTLFIVEKRFNNKGRGKYIMDPEIDRIAEHLDELSDRDIPKLNTRANLSEIYYDCCSAPCIHCKITVR